MFNWFCWLVFMVHINKIIICLWEKVKFITILQKTPQIYAQNVKEIKLKVSFSIFTEMNFLACFIF